MLRHHTLRAGGATDTDDLPTMSFALEECGDPTELLDELAIVAVWMQIGIEVPIDTQCHQCFKLSDTSRADDQPLSRVYKRTLPSIVETIVEIIRRREDTVIGHGISLVGVTDVARNSVSTETFAQSCAVPSSAWAHVLSQITTAACPRSRCAPPYL